MAAVTADASLTADPGVRGPVPARTTGPAAADRSPATARPGRSMRSWPLLVLAAPAAAEVWSGWVGIAQKTGFGLVSPLPGIWPSLHLDTAITLPVGVEAYAAYALRAWLARDPMISGRTRRFAKWSAICSFALGMAGQVAYHLLAQAGMTPGAMGDHHRRVLPAGPGPGHRDRAGAHAARRRRGHRHAGPPDRAGGHPAAAVLVPGQKDQDGPDRRGPGAGRDRSARQDQNGPGIGPHHRQASTGPGLRSARPQMDQARVIARRLAAAGKPVSRRALRSGGVTGSNEALNALARMLSAELAGCAGSG
jgi:hypothetical protein